GHGFPEGPRESQENRAHDAATSKRYDHLPSRLPARGTKREGRFALIAGDGHQHFTRDGNNVRNDHDGENNARGEKTYAIDRALKERQETQGVLQRGLNVLAHQRNDDKNTEQ